MKKIGFIFLTTVGFIFTAHLAVAMPNPASKNCIDQGGKSEIVKGQEGEFGLCHLPDGRVCEEWVLFRNQCQAKAKSTPSLGGWSAVSVNDPEIKKAANFAATQLDKDKAKLQKVISAQSQVVAGKNGHVSKRLNRV